MARPTGNPQWPLKRAVSRFHRDTLEQLRRNMETQKIFPNEINAGFRKVNEERKQAAHGDHSKGWFATGEGARSFEGRIVSDDGAGNVTLEYRYRQYLRFVDMGVMAGVSKEDVERSKKVRYYQRYVRKWAPRASFSHRPGIMPELAHTETRLATYLRDFYGWDFIDTISGIEENAVEVMLGGK